jgi:putative addiction module killer protein
MIEIEIYETSDGDRPFEKWFERIDRQAQDRIRVAFARLEEGNTGSLKGLGAGVSELKISFGPGYRIYLGREGSRLVILLHGGTKKRQGDDITRAKELWRAYLAERDL